MREWDSGFWTRRVKRRRPSARSVAGLLVWAVVSLTVHLVKHEKSQNSGTPLFQGASVNPEVRAIVGRACGNCHSERNEWPWYGHVAPVSWMIERDVKRARQRINFSQWNRLELEGQLRALRATAETLESREMPPRRYLVLHPEAHLSPDELVEVIEWTRAESRRLREVKGHAVGNGDDRE